jgi:hypothetical protein
MAKDKKFQQPNRKVPARTDAEKTRDARKRNEKVVKDPNKHSAHALAQKLKSRKKLLDTI